METPLLQVFQCIVGTWTVFGILLCVLTTRAVLSLPRKSQNWVLAMAVLELGHIAMSERVEEGDSATPGNTSIPLLLVGSVVSCAVGYWAIDLVYWGAAMAAAALVLAATMVVKEDDLNKAF